MTERVVPMAFDSYYLLSLTLAGVGVLVCIALVIQRLYLHPLKNIPGPKLAAITSAYEFYYDCILIGKFHFKVKELHEQYGEPTT